LCLISSIYGSQLLVLVYFIWMKESWVSLGRQSDTRFWLVIDANLSSAWSLHSSVPSRNGKLPISDVKSYNRRNWTPSEHRIFFEANLYIFYNMKYLWHWTSQDCALYIRALCLILRIAQA
jgi:hypothetical protein